MNAVAESLSPGDPLFLLFCLAALFVGLSKGGLPGFGMLGVPVLALTISPVVAAALLLPIFILSDVVGVWLYRREFSAKNLLVLIPAGLVGVLIGWATASFVSEQMVSFLIGLLGISFCLNTWLRKKGSDKPVPAIPAKGFFWGTISGFTSFVSHAGSPPYQVYVLPQKLAKNVFAGTTTILFAVINLAKLIPYAQLQPYTGASLKLAAMLLPVAIAGTIIGKFLTQRVPEKWFFTGVQIALFMISIRLVLNTFPGL